MVSIMLWTSIFFLGVIASLFMSSWCLANCMQYCCSYKEDDAFPRKVIELLRSKVDDAVNSAARK